MMMTITRFEELLDTALDALGQLFREVGRKGAPEHSEVLKSAQNGYYKYERIIREQTPDQKRFTEAVHTTIADTISEQSKGKKNADTVKQAVLSSLATSRAFQRARAIAAPFLAQAAIERDVNATLRRCRTTPAKAEAETKWSDKAPFLDFPNIEEFKGLPKMIEFIVPAQGKRKAYRDQIDYRYSNAQQRESSLILRARARDENLDAYNVEFDANEKLKPLVAKYGDHPPPVLWAKKIQDEKKKPKASGDD